MTKGLHNMLHSEPTLLCSHEKRYDFSGLFLCSSSSKQSPLFSGIIEDLATVRAVKSAAKGAFVTIATRLPVSRIKIGDSIDVNGACLTVVAKRGASISMDVSAETLRRTVLGELNP